MRPPTAGRPPNPLTCDGKTREDADKARRRLVQSTRDRRRRNDSTARATAPTPPGGSMRTHAHQRGLAIALLVLLAVGCRPDRIAEAIRSPILDARPNLDKHGNWGQRGRIVTATLIRTIDRSTVADAVRAAAGQSLPNTAVWAASKAALQQRAVEAFSAYYDVQQWSISYITEDIDGRLVTVSAGIYIPVVDAGAALPILS